MWMFDTNICIYLIRRRSERLRERLRDIDITQVALSAITVAELQYGVAKSAPPEENALALAQFVAPLTILPFDEAAAAAYGPVRAALERAGRPIGSMDLMIGAHALASGRTLVTNNAREFKRIRGLKVENWVQP
jgi:tRNA(fMet)-specific endonuclease VapC